MLTRADGAVRAMGSPADVTTDKNGARSVSIVFVEREETAMYGLAAQQRNYTVVQPAYHAMLNKTRLNATASDAAEVAAAAGGTADGTVAVLEEEVVLETGPTTLVAGTNRSTTFLLPFELTDAVYQFKLQLDTEGVVVELDEANTFVVTFRFCWPPDLSPGTNLTLMPAPEVDARGVLPPLASTTDDVMCLYPDYMVVDGVDASPEHVFFRIRYKEINEGVDTAFGCVEEDETACPFGARGFRNALWWDGVRVQTDAGRPPLPGKGAGFPGYRYSEMVADLGRPDDLNHTLEIQLDSGYEVDEVLEYNNRVTVRARFCGFGADMDAGDGIRFHGTRIAQWGTRRCVTDDDMVHSTGYWIYDEGGGQQYRGRDEMTVHLQYTERNVGAQFANATFAPRPKLGWTNKLFYDGVMLANSTNRAFLGAGESRVVDVSQDYRLVAFTPYPDLDTGEHLLELFLDYDHDVAWEVEPVNNHWWVKLFFCTDVVKNNNDGYCGCARDGGNPRPNSLSPNSGKRSCIPSLSGV